MRALAEFYKALGQCNSISPIVFIIYSAGSPSDHVTGLAMWSRLANSTQRKSKGKAHQKKKTQIYLYYYWVGLGPMGLWSTKNDTETEFATMSRGTSAGVPFDNRPISTSLN